MTSSERGDVYVMGVAHGVRDKLSREIQCHILTHDDRSATPMWTHAAGVQQRMVGSEDSLHCNGCVVRRKTIGIIFSHQITAVASTTCATWSQ